MNALELLLSRHSQSRLEAPAPSGQVLENIKQAALRAPDHASLTPWQFIVFEGNALCDLGQIFLESAIENGADDRALERAPELPLRAPMVIVAATRFTEHPKVPEVEQIQSAACAMHAMQMAAYAQGFNGIWRTGSYAQCEVVKRKLGINPCEELIGFLYLGTTPCDPKVKPEKASSEYFRDW